MESLTLTTSDGHDLAADLATPDVEPVAGAVVCHPHPQYGGDRFNPVVEALFGELADRGLLTIRFDFRREHASGIGEREDVVAALDALTERTDAPLVVAGYSFGAAVSLSTPDARITALAAIAPPLGRMQVDAPSAPVLVLSPRHDQFCPPEAAATAVAEWPDAVVEPVESADHFLVGHAGAVAIRSADWLVRQIGQ